MTIFECSLFRFSPTYFRQVDFAVGFLDDSLDAWRQHFTRIAPSNRKSQECKGHNQLSDRYEHIPYTTAIHCYQVAHLRCKKVDDHRCAAIFNPFVEILYTLDVINFLPICGRCYLLDSWTHRTHQWSQSGCDGLQKHFRLFRSTWINVCARLSFGFFFKIRASIGIGQWVTGVSGCHEQLVVWFTFSSNAPSVVMQWKSFYCEPNENKIQKWRKLHIDWWFWPYGNVTSESHNCQNWQRATKATTSTISQVNAFNRCMDFYNLFIFYLQILKTKKNGIYDSASPHFPWATFSQCRSISFSRATSNWSSSTLHTNSATLSRSPVSSLKRPKSMRKFNAPSFESSWEDFTSHVSFHSTLVMCGKSNPVVRFFIRSDALFFS